MFGFLNLAMLAGLAGLALPILAHLLSKRKFDVVHWGAMQFLELGRRTRRRIRLEELLLLLLRLGVILAIVLAFARPWARGGLFANLSSGPSRDVVYIIDGSYSMGWEGRHVTPHAAAIQWVHESLERLRGGDTVGVLDARDQVRPVVDPPTSDLDLVRAELSRLPGPAGTSRLAPALRQAVQMLSAGTNLRRDVVVLTDGQALPWTLADQATWTRLDAVLKDAAVRPTLWMVHLGSQGEVERVNFSVDRLELSRELTVPEFTVRVQTKVRQSGGVATRRKVYFEINGQRLDDKTLSVNLPPNGEAAVQFEHQFPQVGSYLISVSLDPDHLPGDNRSDAAVLIEEGLPVLLVDGDPQADPVRSETFFARSALTPQSVSSPWVKARVVTAAAFQPDDLQGPAVVFLCNVPKLTPQQTEALQAFVAGGGGLVIAPGDRTDPAAWNQLHAGGAGLLPAAFDVVAAEEDAPMRPVVVANESLLLPGMTMFRDDAPEGGFEFTRVRFARWWRLTLPAVAEPQDPADSEHGGGTRPTTHVAARLNTGDPWIVLRSYDRGHVVQLAGPVDDAWSTLPGRRALAPFLHELVFFLAGHRRGRNVESGAPLLLDIPRGDRAEQYLFRSPTDQQLPAAPAGDELHPAIRLSDTSLPGVYRVEKPDDPAWKEQLFVVNFDREESDLTPLTAAELEKLTEGDRFRVVETVSRMTELQAQDAPRAELWAALLCFVLGLLVFEVFLTRRLVQRGHETVTDDVV